jgi:hypothetical protein
VYWQKQWVRQRELSLRQKGRWFSLYIKSLWCNLIVLVNLALFLSTFLSGPSAFYNFICHLLIQLFTKNPTVYKLLCYIGYLIGVFLLIQ